MALLDKDGSLVKITDAGLVRFDGITAFRRVEVEGVIFIEIYDNDRYRAKCRGTRTIWIPLDILISILSKKEKPDEQQPAGPAEPK